MKVLTLANQKGGVGKTTTALTVGQGLMRRGHSVLFVDLDPQCNLTFLLRANAGGKNVLDVMQGKADPLEAVQKTELGELIGGSLSLAAADITFNGQGKESVIRRMLQKIKGYDFVVLDTPPALGVLTVNALVASDYLLIPAYTDILSIQGMSQLYNTYQAVREYHNTNLKTLGVILTRYDNRLVLTRKMAEMLIEAAGYFGTTVMKERMREYVAIREAQANQMTIFEYAPESNAAHDCLALTDELLNRMKVK